MTVEELIAELRKFDPKEEVTIASPPCKRMQISPIGSVVINGGPSLQTQFLEEYLYRRESREICRQIRTGEIRVSQILAPAEGEA